MHSLKTKSNFLRAEEEASSVAIIAKYTHTAGIIIVGTIGAAKTEKTTMPNGQAG